MDNLAVTGAGGPGDLCLLTDGTPLHASILDSMPVHIAVIDCQGRIQYVNAPWIEFAAANGWSRTRDWRGVNYLDICDNATTFIRNARRAAVGIRKVIRGQQDEFSMEYPCQYRSGRMWFLMNVVPLQSSDQPMFVVSHRDITERKLFEQRVMRESLTDGLTGVANRQYFDDFLNREWRRGARNGQPLSLVMLDIDYFKRFNDLYGHQAGDECLRRIGAILQAFSRRGGDLAARYGGEEFALILANGSSRHAEAFAEQIVADIRDLAIPHARSDAAACVTVSAGVAMRSSSTSASEDALVDAADKALYIAKGSGRNRVYADVAG